MESDEPVGTDAYGKTIHQEQALKLLTDVKLRIDELSEVLATGTRDEKLSAIYSLYNNTDLRRIAIPEGQLVSNDTDESLASLQMLRMSIYDTQRRLELEMFKSLPEDSAVNYRKWFSKNPIGQEAETHNKNVVQAADAAKHNGGPWTHYTCGAVFPMPPGMTPVCPVCHRDQYDTLLGIYHGNRLSAAGASGTSSYQEQLRRIYPSSAELHEQKLQSYDEAWRAYIRRNDGWMLHEQKLQSYDEAGLDELGQPYWSPGTDSDDLSRGPRIMPGDLEVKMAEGSSRRGKHVPTKDVEVLTGERFPGTDELYPHLCPKCNGPSYNSLFSVDCKNKCDVK